MFRVKTIFSVNMIQSWIFNLILINGYKNNSHNLPVYQVKRYFFYNKLWKSKTFWQDPIRIQAIHSDNNLIWTGTIFYHDFTLPCWLSSIHYEIKYYMRSGQLTKSKHMCNISFLLWDGFLPRLLCTFYVLFLGNLQATWCHNTISVWNSYCLNLFVIV